MTDSNQLTQQKSNTPATTTGLGRGMEGIIYDDIKQSYYTLLHPNSKALSTNDAFKAGQIVNSETGEIVGGKGKSIDLYMCNFGRYWYESDQTKQNEMPKKYPMTAQNCGLPRIDGNIKRTPGYEFYCFTRGTTAGFPTILSFRGTSAQAAKSILSYLAKHAPMDLWGCGFAIDSASKQSRTGQNYFYLTAKVTTKTTDAEKKNAENWYERTELLKQTAYGHAEETSDADEEKAPF